MSMDRLKQQLDFLIELDKMKNLYRQTYIINDTDRLSSDGKGGAEQVTRKPRKENDAEHSFHLAIFAAVLAEHSNEPVDVCRVMKMVLVHDVVEIDAGDTYCYDEEGNKNKREREEKAADRLFALLPDDQCAEYRALWEEFEAAETADSKFANALDRLQPMLLNYTKGGLSWKEHNVKYESVIERNGRIACGSEELWEYVKPLIDEYRDNGTLL